MFMDRKEAGERLSEILKGFRGKKCVVYALPRGGLPVAFEVSRNLSLPLDVLIVKKIGAPYQEELALGAVTEGDPPIFYYNKDLMFRIGYSEKEIQPLARKKVEEIGRLREYYREGEAMKIDPGSIAIIVDDGVATGATVKAAVNFFRENGYSKIVVAVPVAHETVLREIKKMADEVYCVDAVPYMSAVGEFYRDFREISHEQAREMLLDARRMISRA
ncbi:hypothetical protein IX51_01410 [uncultured archaeon]|nr:hypothetical protein IX51_01410 [uncultured archaeon]HKJ97105.1 phosphoribosyltransferase family protein [Thermoplasmataceae archaeon]